VEDVGNFFQLKFYTISSAKSYSYIKIDIKKILCTVKSYD